MYLAREASNAVLNPMDPNFSRIRDTVMLDLIVDVDSDFSNLAETTQQNITSPLDPKLAMASLLGDSTDSAVKSAWGALVNKLSSMLESSSFSFPLPSGGASPSSPSTPLSQKLAPLTQTPSHGVIRRPIRAITATGFGAGPIPDWPEPQTAQDISLSSSSNNQREPLIVPPLPWRKIYIPPSSDEDDGAFLCNHRLPAHVPRENQVVVLKRGGGCSFQHKLANIPLFPPAAASLQLVVIVDGFPVDAADATSGMDSEPSVRPLLDERQVGGASGLPRREAIPLVMVGGGEEMLELLMGAGGIGVKRRWEVRVQGIRVENLIVL
jgi:hypothetical protein